MELCEVEIPEQWASMLAHDVIEARESITITALSFLPPGQKQVGLWPALWREICAASDRGVRVTLVFPAPTRAHPATAANSSAAAAAHAAGMRVHQVRGPRLLHAKQVIIDENLCWVGSGNFTAAACTFNHETYARIKSQSLAARLLGRISAMVERGG
jgi:phosphatidylserine/phosphatidylglycerophosphate/cardiolipin synthase-like enzyme